MSANQETRKCVTVGELLEFISKLPPLDPEDAVQFEKDLAEIRRGAGTADY